MRAMFAALLCLFLATIPGHLAPLMPLPLSLRTLSRVVPAPIEIPLAWRVRNWSPHGEGSCVHASIVTLLHWQGLHGHANWWRNSFHSAEDSRGLAAKLDSAGLHFAETTSGDVAFLEWAVRTRRGCAVAIGAYVDGVWSPGAHMVVLSRLDATRVELLDSNHPAQPRRVSRDQFIADWKQSGGWACTIVHAPAPPSPHWEIVR